MSQPLGKLQYKGFGYFDIQKREFKHQKTKIGHISGGTGITPNFHLLQSALRNKDKTHHSMIFGNKTIDDVLLK